MEKNITLSYIPFPLEDIATFFVIFFTLVMILKVFSTLLGENAAERRLRELEERKVEMLAQLEVTPSVDKHYRPKIVTWESKFFALFRKFTTKEASKYQLLVEQAGYHRKDANHIFILIKFLTMISGGILGYLFFFVFNLQPQWNTSLKAIGVMASMLMGSMLLEYLLRNKRKERFLRIQNGFPDSLDIMVISTEAGLSLDHSLERVSKEIGQVNLDLGRELGVLGVELSLIPDRSTAFHNFAKRVDIPTIREFVAALLQAEQQGTPVSHALRTIADESRKKRMIEAEKRAARLPAIMTVPLVLFVLPALFIILAGPAFLGTLRTFENRDNFEAGQRLYRDAP